MGWLEEEEKGGCAVDGALPFLPILPILPILSILSIPNLYHDGAAAASASDDDDAAEESATWRTRLMANAVHPVW